MSIQKIFTKFHNDIKVETEELREKRNLLFEKIKASLKNKNLPVPDLLNQGSYIYGVGVKPVGDVEYDIDVGLDFPIKSAEYEAKDARKWVYDSIADHTKNVEDRGPCIRVRYAAGYHVDLVIYARYSNNETVESYQLAHKDNSWRPTEPKKLKEIISNARRPFADSKDSSGSDQLQRITRYLKRWNDYDIPNDSPDKPFGLATMLLVMKFLPSPILDYDGSPNDLKALINIAQSVSNTVGRIILHKPTLENEDVFAKLSEPAMERFKSRFKMLLSDLNSISNSDESQVGTVLQQHFGPDFPSGENNSKNLLKGDDLRQRNIADMNAAIPSFSNPSKPWTL